MSDSDLELLKIEVKEKQLVAKRIKLEGELKLAEARRELNEIYNSATADARSIIINAQVDAIDDEDLRVKCALNKLRFEEMNLAAEKNKLLGERKLAALQAEIKQQAEAADKAAADAEEKLLSLAQEPIQEEYEDAEECCAEAGEYYSEPDIDDDFDAWLDAEADRVAEKD